MSETKVYIQNLFNLKGVDVPVSRTALFETFVADDLNLNAVAQILENQKMLIDKWKLKNRITDIQQQTVTIPNGTVGKPYHTKVDFIKLGWNDIILSEVEGLEETGLVYDNEEEVITGTPVQSGDIKVILKFRVNGEKEDSILNEKVLPLIINPDPKSLWQNRESDKEDPYWKEDHVSDFVQLGDRSCVAVSKRGRSHANAGTFRDDHYALKNLEQSGWNIVAVADGAGSAKFSRKGSELACNAVIEFFNENFTEEKLREFDEILADYKTNSGEESQKKLSRFVYDTLSKAAFSAHSKVAEYAKQKEVNLKDFYTTLIFTAFKKYDFGYALLSFGVGDCPIALLNKDLTEVSLMNWLDVGEFGGGTRFINMPEIFSSDKFSTRFRFKLVEDFSYLFLMTDGIYDPKFVVEANLEKVEKWKEFLEDLKGNNEEGVMVNFDPENKEIESQLSAWMDFWSPGNHDDRTLAVIF